MKIKNILYYKVTSIFILVINIASIQAQLDFNQTSLDFNQPPKPRQVVPITLHNPVLSGQILSPQGWGQSPEFRIFFEGKQTINDKEGMFYFPIETKDITKLYILICKELKTNFSSINTIKNLQINPKGLYRFFVLKKNHPATQEWQITEKKMEKKKFIVPQNCLIFLINPKYIGQIRNWTLKAPDNLIKLPQIVLKAGFNEKKVKREADKSIIRAFPFNAFHENISQKIKSEAKPNVSLALTQAI